LFEKLTILDWNRLLKHPVASLNASKHVIKLIYFRLYGSLTTRMFNKMVLQSVHTLQIKAVEG